MADTPLPPIWQQYRPVTPKVELGKETRKEILQALQNIKTQIAKPRFKENTASDVAADTLAGGQNRTLLQRQGRSGQRGEQRYETD